MTLVVASEGMGIWCKDFFMHLASFKYKDIIFEKSTRSNLILRTMFLNLEPTFPKLLPYVTWSGESFDCSDRSYPPMLKLWDKIPFLVVAFFELQAVLNIKFNLDDIRIYKNSDRPYFLAYCASASYAHREKMFKLLKNHGIAHALGKCQNNVGQNIQGTWHDLPKIYSKYRYVMAMENKKQIGYITEKILVALVAGATPIYYGDSTWVKRVFGTDGIIFVNDFSSFEECAQYIINHDTHRDVNKKVIEKQWFEGDNELYRELASKIVV